MEDNNITLQFIVSIILGWGGYLITKLFVDPLLNIRNLRKEMHKAILQYGNLGRVIKNEPEYRTSRRIRAQETYRNLAATGIAENENLHFKRSYCFARWWINKRWKINLGAAAEKFWAMEAFAADPGEGREEVVEEIRTSLSLPKERKKRS